MVIANQLLEKEGQVLRVLTLQRVNGERFDVTLNPTIKKLHRSHRRRLPKLHFRFEEET